jgi:Cof subfamily protein (haloacid dehalogenase superfamily)
MEFMTDFSKIILLSDMDGTLLGDRLNVSERNRRAIEKFITKGGTFGIATGRGPAIAKPFIEGVKTNGPSIVYNGAMLYDFRKDTVMEVITLKKDGLTDILSWILTEHKEMMVYVYTEDEGHLISDLCLADEEVLEGHTPYVVSTLDEVSSMEWVKILLAGNNENLGAVRSLLEGKNLTDCRWVNSSDIFLEILPAGVSKATLFPKLKERFGRDMNIVVLGDYYNDLEMLKEADYSVAMGNAPEDLKVLAKEVTGTNLEDGVALFIERLLEGSVIL